MCGLAGFLTRDSNVIVQARAHASRMTDAIQHRGPDDGDVWIDPEAGIALGHRRLAVVDVSEAGHQPMTSASGRYILAFNGEIYNHLELRAELDSCGTSPPWRGHSDTETLLATFERWGIEATLTRTVGMFAISLWDRKERKLYLARDRFGEKPLYYGWAGSSFVFASELKALRAHPGFSSTVCQDALALYLRFMYVPAPHSIYRGIYKLEPGCLLQITDPPPHAPSEVLRPPAIYGGMSLERWWSFSHMVESAAASPIVSDDDALDVLESRLTTAVQLQSLSDVPLGAFLSGGVDSSTIVALMQVQSSRPVSTFTIGFEETEFDESAHARAVAAHLGTNHSEMMVTSAKARQVIPDLPMMYDEPFADSSQIPTFLVCHAARQHVTVALSGDGGDELFGGYNRYSWGPRIWDYVDWLPYALRRSLASAITAVSVEAWNTAQLALGRAIPRLQEINRMGDKAHKLATRLRTVENREDLYLSLVSEWTAPEEVLARGSPVETRTTLSDPLPVRGVDSESLMMMYRDTVTYLPDDILCKVDRASMATSLEARAPFLDHRVAELAWRLPLSMKIRGGETKWALRQVLYRHVPRSLIERPKAGFAVPVGEWLRGPLKPWAMALIDERKLQTQGFFRPHLIRKKWREHQEGSRDHTAMLWAILMFQAWYEKNP